MVYLEKKFKIMLVKMIHDHKKRMEALKIDKIQETFSTDLEELKNKS